MSFIGCLGKLPPREDARTLRLARYLTGAVPPPPHAVNWADGISNWGMMLNDKLGDCTIAGLAHAIQVWTAKTSQEVTIPDAPILSAYENWAGYVDGDPSTDRGAVELDILNRFRKEGLDGHQLLGYAAVGLTGLTEIRTAIALFGGVYIGVALPIAAQSQDVWDVVSGPDGEPGSWGGHCIYVPAYDKHTFTCVTWGGLKQMTTEFFSEYADEAYSLFGKDWINTGGTAPSGFNEQQLTADLAQLV